MIEMTNLEYFIANLFVNPKSILDYNGEWQHIYESPWNQFQTKEQAIEEVVLWMRQKHEEE